MGATGPFDYPGMRTTANSLIEAAGMKCSLQRGGVRRDCWAVIYDYRPKDAASQLANPTDRAVLIAADFDGSAILSPDREKDSLVTYVQPGGTVVDEVLTFTMPIKQTRPAGLMVVYEGVVRR